QRQASALERAPWKCDIIHTKPQQSNTIDCGLDVLHYLDKIRRSIVELRRPKQAPASMSG
ncbi:hypothetical protein PHYSODRAFT_518504, partial [Phytophthora sojae]